MIRNQVQRVACKAFDTAGAVSGDAANLRAKVSIDDGPFVDLINNAAVETVAGSGTYHFNLTAAETDGYKLEFDFQSGSGGVQVIGSPDDVIFTRTGSAAAVKDTVR